MKCKATWLLIVLLLFSTFSLLYSSIDPSWYNHGFVQGAWLSGGTHDLDWNNGITNGYIGQFHVSKNSNTPPNFNPNITVILTFPEEQLLFYNQHDPSKTIPYTVTLQNGPTISQSPHTQPYSLANRWSHWVNLNLNVYPPSPASFPPGVTLSDYEGLYSSFISIQIYVGYGTADQILLGQTLMGLAVNYRQGGTVPIFYQLFLDRYPSADSVNVPAMSANQTSTLTVGAVTLISNDSNTYKRSQGQGGGGGVGNTPNPPFKFYISPVNHPGAMDTYLNTFAFRRVTNASSPIPFRVYVPGRSTPSTNAFYLPVQGQGLSNHWQDFIEIAITSVNYDSLPTPAGAYSATIRIELINTQ